MPEVLTIRDAVARAKAEGYPVSEYSLRAWVRSRQVPTVQAGNRALLYYPNLLRFLRCEGNGPKENRQTRRKGFGPSVFRLTKVQTIADLPNIPYNPAGFFLVAGLSAALWVPCFSAGSQVLPELGPVPGPLCWLLWAAFALLGLWTASPSGQAVGPPGGGISSNGKANAQTIVGLHGIFGAAWI